MSFCSRLVSGASRGVVRALCVVAGVGLGAAGASAQAPIALPYTITTVVGGGSTQVAGSACSATSTYKAADSYGNGCPGLNATLSSDLRGGLATDGQGNLYIADTSNSLIRKYDPRTGLITKIAGKGTACGTANGQLDSGGDGCPMLQTSFASTPRGIATDPYGNVLVAGYGDQMVHIVCLAASPLCPNTTGHKQVGSMYRIAGCVAAATSSGTAAAATANTAGTEGDNTVASPFENLSGDVADWGAGVTGSGTCSNSVGILNQPRGVGADKYGNVYIGETGTTNVGLRYRVVLGPQTSTYFSGTNPLWAILNSYSSYTAHQGYIYTILGGFATVPAKGATCGTSGQYTAEDAKGDGCPFYNSSANGGEQGVAADGYGNVFFADTVNSLIRVLYAGGSGNPLTAAIAANSGGTVTTPVAGNVYVLAGGGATGITTTATLGSSTLLSNQFWKIQVGPNGNLYLGDDSAAAVYFYDITTGYIRQLFKSGTACAAHVNGSNNGDGCPASQATYSGGSSAGFGVAVDPLGNLYLGDIEASSLIRKVEAVSLVPTVVGSTTAAGTTFVQTLDFHGPVGTASMTANALNAPADITLGSATCTTLADNTADCTVPVTFAPSQPGQRSLNLAVQMLDASSNVLGSAVVPVSGTAVGSALVTDVSSPSTSKLTATSGTVAVGGAGNIYTVDKSTPANVVKVAPSGTTTTIGAAPAGANQIAVDTAGNVYVASIGASSLTKFTLNLDGSYTASTLTNAAIAAPQAVAVDANGNVFVADKTTGSVYEIPAGSYFSAYNPTSAIATGFTNPVGLALDGQGNLYVADKSNGVYQVTSSNNVLTTALYAANSGGTITVSGLTPVAVTADPGGDVYVQDSSSGNVLEIPAIQTGPTTVTVLSGVTSPAGVAVDGNGVLYSADAGSGQIVKVARNAATFDFGTSITAQFSGVVTNAGNLTATGYQTAGQDSAEFPITSVSPSNCFAATSILPGYPCSITSMFTPTSGSGTVSSVLAYTVASSTTGALTLQGTKSGATVTTTTAIGTQTPANPIYAAAGTEVSFPVSVTASDNSTASGYVNVTIDNGTPVAYSLTNASVTVSLSGLSAGSHTIVAAYPTQSGVTGSTSASVSFTIAQSGTTVNWTPGATTQQFSSAVGTSVLNAAAVVSGTSTNVPGYFVYTATPSGGSAQTIHAASYLPIGTYSLAVTFVPLDSTDYTGSTATVASYTVTKASTSAPIGASQTVVAADGTGNFTSVQAAVNAIPATGGTVYIKPGTYTGDVTVVQPNVALRGLGGDPTQVVITHEGGAFSGGVGYEYAGEFTSAQNNGAQLPAGSSLFSGDEGSATLVVAKGVNTAVSTATLNPNNFYAENLSLVNTYDTDPATTTTYISSGSCTANAGPARTHVDLFSNGLLCASQALAIWTTSDLSVMNNVYTTSMQDTIYAGSQGGSPYVPARQYWFRGKVTGVVDYIFGDAAAVFDYSSIYTGNRSTATVHAQNKKVQTGTAGDYLSGYIMNSNIFTSYSTGQSNLYFGRPYGAYSTYLMLNSQVDQVNALGYEEFSGQTNLPTSTFAEYNTQTYTDPATGSPDANGVTYLGNGGNTGSGVTGTRETVSQSPGTPMASNALKTSITAAQATLYYPTAFLGGTVSNSSTGVTNWNPTAALATYANSFVPSTANTTITFGSSITVLMRPQTPGLGAIANGSWTIPTGTYTVYDGTNVLATGSLDVTGEASLTTSTLSIGAHNLTWTYSGDTNFSGSTTSTPMTITVTGQPTTTTLGLTASPITYGQDAALNVTATPQSGTGTPTGTATATVDSTTSQTATLSKGTAAFTFGGLTAGTHSFTGVYNGDSTYAGSTSSALSLTVNQAALTATGSCANRIFGAPNVCSGSVSGYQYSDSASTVLSGTPSGTTAATRISAPGTYTASPAGVALTTFGAANYTLSSQSTTFTISGGAAQVILFPPIGNLAAGRSYQLAAHATSGLPVAYTVTSGNATVSGTTLTINGAGPVTVQATCKDTSGRYADAAAVSRSFTAQ